MRPDMAIQFSAHSRRSSLEGVGGMAILISKALSLSDGDKIKDPTILSQIRRR